MTGTYNISLVALSFSIAVIASYTALDLAGRVCSALNRRIRLLWLLGGAVAMGTGIWSMHFIAMLAFRLPKPVGYDVWVTLLSLVYAVLASGIALWLLSRPASSWLLLIGGGICMGIAIASMHYTGMTAMQLQAQLAYDWRLVGLSVAIAIIASFVALWLAFRLQHESSKSVLWQKFGSAFVMGIAISGMHYTGMWATRFMPQHIFAAEPTPILSQPVLAIAVGGSTLFILSLTLLTSLFDQRLSVYLIRAEALQESEKRFRMLIGEMQVGVLLLNANAEILTQNQAAIELLNLKDTETEQPIFGQDWQLIHEDYSPFQMADLPVQRAIAQRQPMHCVIGIDCLDTKKQRWLLVNANPQIAEDGSVERVICTLSDITDQKQAEAALRQSEERFALAMAGANDGIWDWDLKTDYIYLSPRWKNMLGYTDLELPNHIESLYQILHPDDATRVRQVLHHYLTGKVLSYEVEFRAQHKDSSWRWILARGIALWSEKTGQPYRMVGAHTDITQRKQAETALQQMVEREQAIARIIQRMRQTLDLQTIFSATTQELQQAIHCDRVVIYRFNPDWSGEFVAESIAEGWTPLLQPQQPTWTEATVNQDECALKALSNSITIVQDTYLQETKGGIYAEGVGYRCVMDVDRAGFEQCYLDRLKQLQARSYITVPIFCGNKMWGLLGSYQNSEPRQWNSSEIKMVMQIGTQLGVAVQQAELLAQTQQQAEELKEAKESADAANRAKSQFLANMSHELRTPLNAILGFTQLMHRDSALGEKHRQFLDIISHSGEHLLELINDVLELSKIEAGRATLHENRFDLHQLLDSIERMLKLKAQSKGLQLVVDRASTVPQWIKTDDNKLRQVLINLLNNAIKFTHKGSVVLQIHSDEEIATDTKTTLQFKVEDTGPGIDPDEIDKLFIAFEQTKVGLDAAEGTGLGLPISQKFVQLMGGEITVTSQPGVGSCFAFEIPVYVEHQPTDKPGQADRRRVIGLAPNQPTYRMLVVEDSTSNRFLLVKMLSSLGFEVQEATNGQEAIATWQRWNPHLIWMDMQMPIMNGYDATRSIKATVAEQKEERSPVIIAITASAFEEQRQAILSVGCDDFVRKPFRREELLAKVNQHLGVEYLYEEEVAEIERSA
jgi:two-component system, sensor histidine kinase and response regulator